ncbi:MAG TPA: NADH-ubiquinone oxidoreductase-F iron-sulfur binding region domain-containing protein, partial [Bacteroidales bacterium]|nr:NADH-ubiquinone oxidoreductase-F iron-sulfur binding region domain-containing protein [Bacteroidales bacterium]
DLDSTQIYRRHVTVPSIKVGMGTCGTIAGANRTFEAIQQYLSERSISANCVRVGCLGLCSLEPLVEVHLPGRCRLLLKNVHHSEVFPILDDLFHQILPEEYAFAQYRDEALSPWNNVPFVEELPFFSLQNRVVLANCGKINPFDIEEYLSAGGYKAFQKAISVYTSAEVCDLIEESGLRGRSGGGFPTGRKWKSVLYSNAAQKYVICNAEESDPGAFMDRAIIEGDPHRVLEGISIAAYAVGATKAYIYIRTEYTIAIQTLEQAIRQAREKGLLGQNILNSGFSLDISIKKCPGAFVCGEETALIASIEGKRGMPETKPPYPSAQGLFKKPTVVNNVETFANVPAIIQNGPAWFAAIGTAQSKGTKIFAISGKTKYTGVVEVNMGTTLRKIIFDIIGGIKDNKRLRAIFLGGPIGHCLTESEMDIPIGFDELRQAGLSMGSGGMVVLDEDNCIVDTLRYFSHFMQHQSCGKCIPCREGTRRLSEIFDKLTRKPDPLYKSAPIERIKAIMQLEPLADVMRTTSLCGLGQSAATPVLSALQKFKSDFEEHLYERKCSANVCKQLRSYSISPKACTGCGVCVPKCPTEAIKGSLRSTYYIIEELCISCGKCVDACKFNAILIQ